MNAAAFDFIESFPWPDDEDMHRAGRQGILDQKEDEGLSDQEWLAIQHDGYACDAFAWLDELAVIKAEAIAIERGARRFRKSEGREGAERALRAGRVHAALLLRGLLNDYACHYGDHARAAFVRFLVREARATRVLPTPPTAEGQGCLF